MIKINVKKVLQEAEIKRNTPKPLPKVKMRYKSPGIATHGVVDEALSIPDVPLSVDVVQKFKRYDSKTNLLHQLEGEYADVRMERNKLSSKICTMVEDGADEGELRNIYHKIESYRIPLQEYYDKIAYVKQHGHLPEVKQEPQHEFTLFELKDQKRKLIDKRCKLQAKLKPSAKSVKPSQLANWQLELEQCNAMYEDVDMRIKKMEGRA
jgi:hypothetical protein